MYAGGSTDQVTVIVSPDCRTVPAVGKVNVGSQIVRVWTGTGTALTRCDSAPRKAVSVVVNFIVTDVQEISKKQGL